MKTQLVTCSSDYKKNNKRKYYLGVFCNSDKIKYKPYFFNKKNTFYFDDTKNIENYRYLKKVSKKIFLFLAIKLNKFHKCKKDLKYWRIIIYPWICYYVATLNDRWKIISGIEKSKKKFWVKKFILDKNFLEIESTLDWILKSQNGKFNNNLFNKIIEFKKLKNIEQVLEKNQMVLKKKGQNFFFSFFNKILFFLNLFFLHCNKIYFDKVLIKKSDFIKLCFRFKLLQIKNNTIFDNLNFNVNYNYNYRNTFKRKKNKNFENFLFSELKNYTPKTFIEKYPLYLNTRIINKLKRKIILGFYSASFNDYFKIFVAESKLKKSRFIHAPHGAGCHLPKKYDVHFNYFKEISDKLIVTSQKIKKNKKEIFVPLKIFKDKIKKKNPYKLLICYHDLHRYIIRPTLFNLTPNINLKLFDDLVKNITKLNPEIQRKIMFRGKENKEQYFNKKFIKIFGKKKIEYINKKSFRTSIGESKIIICFLSQTSFTEILYNNIPVILIKDRHLILSKKNIYKKFLENNILFNEIDEAFDFINANWQNIDVWWNDKETQAAKNLFLKEFFYDEKKLKNNEWTSFLERELKKI